MAKQDAYVRYTLRLPEELHAKLVAAAGDASLNAEMIRRLQDSLAPSSLDAKIDKIMAHLGIGYTNAGPFARTTLED